MVAVAAVDAVVVDVVVDAAVDVRVVNRQVFQFQSVPVSTSSDSNN